LQKWNPIEGWGAEEPCDNIAWAAADVIRNEDYGRGLATSRFNIENLYRLDQIWETRGDKFHGVFDTTSQLWEALKVILMCGRATPMYYAGVIDFIRDEPQSIVTAQFSPATMVKGSFNLTYQFHDHETPDHVVIEYTDPTSYKTAEVTCAFPDSLKRNPTRVTVKGCKSRDQAYKLGMSMIASNRDRRKSIEFSTLKPGLIPGYNSLIRVMHDVPQWGYGGRVLSFNRTTGQVRTTEPVPFDPTGEYKVAFRKRNGAEDGPYSIIADSTLDSDSNEFGFILVGTELEKAQIYISNGVKEDYTHYSAGPSEQRGILALVQKCRPDSQGRVAITCINYADSVYTAENGGITPPLPPESNLPGLNDRPVIDSVTVVYTITVGVQNIVATVTRNAIYYEFQAKTGTNDWQRLGTSDVPTLVANLSPGEWTVRVRGVGRIEGPWASWTGTIEATSLPTPRLTAFVGTSKLFGIDLNWAFDPEMSTITKSIEIRMGITDVFASSSLLITLPYPASKTGVDNLGPSERRYFWARCTDTAGRFGPWFNNQAAITQISDTNPDKMLDYLTDQISKQQLTAELIAEIESPDVDLGPVYAAIDEERILRENSDGALAQTIDSTTAIANGAMAATQVNAQSIANTNGSLSAMYTIKTQLTVGGIPYIAGIGIGVSNETGTVTTTISMLADKFALINNNSGVISSPFMVDGNNTYIKSAFIQQATIVTALIGATLNSVAVDGSGNPILSLNFQTGAIVSRGIVSGVGRVERDGLGKRVYDGNNVLRLRDGIW
jgi:predicted phage tail protein